MVKELRHVDVSKVFELKRLAKEVVESGEALVLCDRDIDLAVISPVKPTSRTRRRLREQAAADMEAFRLSAGAWADVDTEEILRYIYDARDRGVRPLQH